MDIASSLLEYGARADAESKNGFTPLHLASQEGHTDMVSLLLEHGANADCYATVSIIDSLWSCIPLLRNCNFSDSIYYGNITRLAMRILDSNLYSPSITGRTKPFLSPIILS